MELWISAVGAVISAVGVVIAIYVAWAAKTAAEAAEDAATKTRSAIQRELTIIDVERVNARIEALRVQHRNGQWEAALATYYGLRNMLYDIRSRPPRLDDVAWYDDLTWAAERIYDIEDSVEQSLQSKLQPDVAELNRALSQIQSRISNNRVGDSSGRQVGEE